MAKTKVIDNKGENPKIKKSILRKELYASEVRYRRLFESAKDGILILDAETGKIVDVNPFLIDLLGFSKKEFVEKSIWEIGAFQDIIENKDKFLELQQSEYVRYEALPLETSNGSKIQVEFVSCVYLVNSNKVIQCQIRDITARKETEAVLEKNGKELAELKKSADELNEFTENIIDTIREPLLAIDKDLRVIKASGSFYRFFKVTAEDTIGKLIYELGNHQWDIPKLKDLLENIIPEKNFFDNYEVEHNFSTIGKRVMLLNARQVKRAFGKEQIILLAIEDITERKGKENSLKETHRATSDFLNILLNHLHTPIIVWDTSMIIKRFNRQFELLSGYNSAEVIDKKIDFLFPKDKIAVTLELLKNHLDDKLDVAEIDILTKDNNIKTVLWNSSRILDEEGKNIIATISQDITSRKHTEDKLNLLETRYRRLFESAKDGILILDAETGKIVDVNPFLIELLGYTKQDFTEKSIWELGTFQDIYENKEKFLELQQKEYVRYDDLPLVTLDGREIHVEFVSNVYLCNNIKVIQCTIRDITERANIQSEIKFQSDLINNVGQAVIATDLLGKVIYWNNAAETIYGWSSSEAIGQNIIHLTPALQTNEQAIDIMQNLGAGTTWSGEFRVKRKDGSNFPAFVTDAPILDSNGKLSGIIGISSDITERKRFEIELIEAKERAEESDRLKSAFLANMSHEIRTPMNGILGFTELLLDPDLSSEQKEAYINIVNQSGQRMLNTVNDIVEISKIEAGIVTVDFKEVDVQVCLDELIRFFIPEATRKGLKLTLEIELSKTATTIITDQNKFDSILTNLIKNAIKYTPSGEITLGCMVKAHRLEFYVKDTGVGIPEERQQAIFERFVQADIRDKDARQGSGLGLAIAKAYVNMLGGEIGLESRTGEGSRFFFSLPFGRQPLEKTREKIEEEENSNQHNKIAQIKGLQMVIAEDDFTSALFLKTILNKGNHTMILTQNGQETVEACRNNPGVDLVLMDIQMPGMNGYDATREIRKFNKKVVIIAQTAFAISGDREKALEAGCNDHISKPISKGVLLGKIQKWVKV